EVTPLYAIDAGRRCWMSRRPVLTPSATAVPRRSPRLHGVVGIASTQPPAPAPHTEALLPHPLAVPPGCAASSVDSRSITVAFRLHPSARARTRCQCLSAVQALA